MAICPQVCNEGPLLEKSDVFSFGVLLLEIIRERRNNSFYHDEQSLSLLGFVSFFFVGIITIVA